MAFGKKSNKSILEKQDKMKQGKHRDVFNTQQLERSDLPQAQTMAGRNVLNGVLTFFVVLVVWLGVSAYDMLGTGKGEVELNGNPASTWFHVAENYVSVDDPSVHISVEEYRSRVAKFAQAGKVDPVPDPGDPPSNDIKSEWSMLNGLTYVNNITGEQVGKDEYQRIIDDADNIYQSRLAQYNADKKAYDDYMATVVDPTTQWKVQVAHYRNVGNTEEFVREEEYDEMAEKYRKDVDRKRLSDDLLAVPDRPIDLSKLYEPYEYGLVPTKINLTGPADGTLTLGGQEDPVEPEPVETEPVETEPAETEPVETTPPQEQPGDVQIVDPGDITDANDPSEVYMFDAVGDAANPWVNRMTGERISNARYEELKAAYEAGEGTGPQPSDGGGMVLTIEGQGAPPPEEIPEGMEWGPVTYRNRFDGTIISADEFNQMANAYEMAKDQYDAAYQAHREQWHPDDIDGTRKVFSLFPNLRKLFITVIVGALFFAVMYAILKKNLDAENQLSTTKDINQYKNDQHIMLPEEIQVNYDWFPDVGAHSGVQVSSMISHMALLNKGLKRVDLARRAEKDIKDEDGDVEYFKGEILMDEEGKPITDSVPLIDEKFMDDLFDASGAQKEKEARQKYDATKIPYNPDGANRDKLGKYATVADLINADWEFPLYEPQRPGGAYIVDTAPVNTMVLAITRAGKGW